MLSTVSWYLVVSIFTKKNYNVGISLYSVETSVSILTGFWLLSSTVGVMIIWSYFDYPHQIQFSSILLTFAFTSAWSGHGNILQLHINGRQHFASMLSRQISYIFSEEKMKKKMKMFLDGEKKAVSNAKCWEEWCQQMCDQPYCGTRLFRLCKNSVMLREPWLWLDIVAFTLTFFNRENRIHYRTMCGVTA